MAFLDALGAYAEYRQATSRTAELEAEGRALRQELHELKKQLLMQAKQRDLAFSTDMRTLREQLERENVKLGMDVMELDSLTAHIKRLGAHIAAQRLASAPNCVPLLRLERTYYQLVDTQLSAALMLVSG
jgi:hypothetical protein